MAVNLWSNADLETGIDDWAAEAFATLAQSTDYSWTTDGGTHSLKISGANNYAGAKSVAKDVTELTEYTISYYVYPIDGATSFRNRVLDQDDNIIAVNATATYTQDTWTRVERTFTTDAGDTGVKIFFTRNNDASEADFYIDGVMLETGSSASEWTNYVEADVNVTPPSLAMSTVIYNPVVTASTSVWDAGAYIYAAPESGVNVTPPSLQTTIQIHDPVVYAVDVPTAVAPPLLQTNIQMFNPTVSVGRFRNRVCSMLHLIMRG